MIGKIAMLSLAGILVGAASTMTMDALGSLARKVGLAAGASGQWVGRWYLGMARGQFVHANIAASPEQAGEKHAALIGHYLIGIALAGLYVVAASVLGVNPASFAIAIGYGLATCVFPWTKSPKSCPSAISGRCDPLCPAYAETETGN